MCAYTHTHPYTHAHTRAHTHTYMHKHRIIIKILDDHDQYLIHLLTRTTSKKLHTCTPLKKFTLLRSHTEHLVGVIINWCLISIPKHWTKGRGLSMESQWWPMLWYSQQSGQFHYNTDVCTVLYGFSWHSISFVS